MAAHVCPWWLAYSFDNPLRVIFHKPEQMLSNWVTPGMTVADIGCGMGYFAIALARIVGEEGKVIAADLQPEMLTRMSRRALNAGVAGRIQPQLCDSNNIKITANLDFALAFWMVHETPSAAEFYRQVFAVLKNGGKLLVAEPKLHVGLADFQGSIALAERTGFRKVAVPRISFSNAAVLEKGN